jgi:hypothetical protein
LYVHCFGFVGAEGRAEKQKSDFEKKLSMQGDWEIHAG